MWMETWGESAGSVAHGWGAGHGPGNYYFFIISLIALY